MATATGELSGQVPASAARAMPWSAIGWFTTLLIVVYFPILKHLVNQWATDEDVGHGFFVPVVAGFVAWQRRDQLLKIVPRPAWWGALVILWSAVQSYIGSLGAELFLQRTAFIIGLVGVLLLVGGVELTKALAFPLALLPFMIPIPAVIYNQITFPLQLFASSVAETVLGWFNIPVLRDGNVLVLSNQTLNVAEACSGIRSLLSLTFLSLVYAYFFDKRVWMRWALLFGTIPIAILANAGRVTITGMLSGVDPDLAHGAPHLIEGWIIFLIAFIMLFVLHFAISRVAHWGSGRKAMGHA
jgi:exosortase